MRSLDQARGRYALECIGNLRQHRALAVEFRQVVQQVPAILRTNGLGQTVAYLKDQAQRREGVRRLLDAFDGWLSGVRDEVHPERVRSRFLDSVAAGHRAEGIAEETARREYLRATDAAWHLCEWLKPLAIAYLPEGGQMTRMYDRRSEGRR